MSVSSNLAAMPPTVKLDIDFVYVISARYDAEALVERILTQHEYVALDIEGVNLGDGPITLVQIAVMPYSTKGEERRRTAKYKSEDNPFESLFAAGSSLASSPWTAMRVETPQSPSQDNGLLAGLANLMADAKKSDALSKSVENLAETNGEVNSTKTVKFSGSQSAPRPRTNSEASRKTRPSNWVKSSDHDNENIHPEIYLFDIQTNNSLIWALEPLFTSVDVVKVVHDARGDVRALDNYYGIRLRRIFDTQVADLLIQEFQEGNGVPRRSSLNSIARMYGGAVNPYKEMIRELYYDRGFAYYDQRPLTMEMLYHAAHDVHSLLPAVYRNQIDQLKPGSDVWNRFINRMRAMVRVKPQMF